MRPEEKSRDEYRALIVAAEQKAQDDFDKSLLTVASGALGVSFAFVKDIVGDKPLVYPNLLTGAWILWGLSIGCVLFSYYVSRRALRKALEQLDQNTIWNASPGGWYSYLTEYLNAFGGIAFLTGIVMMSLFAVWNLE